MLKTKRYLSTVAISTLVFLSIAISVNYVVDPAYLFDGGRFERDIAKAISDGSNLIIEANYDERVFQRFYAGFISESKEILVIGSSRSLQISSEMFASNSFFNASVSGATLGDYIAIYENYREKGLKPAQLVLGVDPWILNGNGGEAKWTSIREQHDQALARLMNAHKSNSESFIWMKKLNELISLRYLQDSIRKLFHRSGRFETTPGNYGEKQIKRADGALNYGRTQPKTIEEIRAGAIVYAQNDPVYFLEHFEQLNPYYVTLFSRFLMDLIQDGIEITLFLPPYHPITYQLLIDNPEYQIIQNVEDYFREFAKKNGIHLKGSYDPKKIPCAEIEFNDAMHPEASCVERALTGNT